MKLTNKIAITVAVGGLVIAGCGSTRFVVVDSQPRREPVSGTTVPAGPTGTTSGTTVVTPQPADANDLAEIKKVVASVFSVEPAPLADRLARVVGGADLGPTVEAVLKLVEATGADVIVERATVAGDSATAIVSVKVAGEPFASDVPVDMVRSDDTWKVTRTGACAVLALGSPCPDAPKK